MAHSVSQSVYIELEQHWKCIGSLTNRGFLAEIQFSSIPIPVVSDPNYDSDFSVPKNFDSDSDFNSSIMYVRFRFRSRFKHTRLYLFQLLILIPKSFTTLDVAIYKHSTFYL